MPDLRRGIFGLDDKQSDIIVVIVHALAVARTPVNPGLIPKLVDLIKSANSVLG